MKALPIPLAICLCFFPIFLAAQSFKLGSEITNGITTGGCETGCANAGNCTDNGLLGDHSTTTASGNVTIPAGRYGSVSINSNSNCTASGFDSADKLVVNGVTVFTGFGNSTVSYSLCIYNNTASSFDLPISIIVNRRDETVTVSYTISTSNPGGCTNLPIELLSIHAKVINEGIALSWSTSTEKNNDYMAVERSVDGENFSEIGRVNGVGYSVERHDYSFVDRFPYQGVNYYRLRQVDFDGTVTYHKVIAQDFNNASVNTLGFFPDANGIQVQFRSPSAAGRLVLIDAAGRLIGTQAFDAQSYGAKISTNGLPKGFYVVQVRLDDGKLEAWPFVK